MNRKLKEDIFFMLFRGCALAVAVILVVILGYVIINGLGKISLDLFTKNPAPNYHGAMVSGGILSPIVGTFMLMVLVLGISIPVGVIGAVFLTEYGGKGRVTRTWWLIVNNLAGVPSIVWGLIGVGLFVYYLNFGKGLLTAGITLSFLVLPLIMVATKEAIDAIPPSMREASIALGSTKWQTTRHHVLPYAASGILTGVILSLSRAAGETAPLLLLGVAVTAGIPAAINDSFQALPYYIYLMTQTADRSAAIPMAYAAALVLIALIVIMNLGAIALRDRYREKYRW